VIIIPKQSREIFFKCIIAKSREKYEIIIEIIIKTKADNFFKKKYRIFISIDRINYDFINN